MTTAAAPRPATLSGLAGRWRADTVHSSVSFEVEHMRVSLFRGDLPEFEATLEIEDGLARLSGTGACASIVTRDDVLTAHLRAPDLFDAERHPELRLSSTSFELMDGDVTVEAALTVKGITRPVVLGGWLAGPVRDPFGGDRIGLRLECAIDRRDFGLDAEVPLLPGGGLALGTTVAIVAQLELVRED